MKRLALYIANLPGTVSVGQLRELFREFGGYSAQFRLARDDAGRFKGYAFVNLSPSRARKAIAALNGRDLGGRAVTVAVREPGRERNSGEEPSGGRE